MIYSAAVHRRFDVSGQAFAYAASTGAVAALDAEALAVLDAFPPGERREHPGWLAGLAPDAARDRREAFEDLVALGLLRAEGAGEPGVALPPMPFPISTLVLNVTNRCNLACTYCYEFGPDRLRDEAPARLPRMSAETARAALDLLFERSGAAPRLSVTFFGGETLLNVETIRAAVLYAEERARETGKRVGFSLTTNATLLDDATIAFLAEHRFGINVSIDGAKADHDRHRTFHGGRGSYDAILPRVKQVVAALGGRGRPVAARVTLTRGMDDVRATYRHLAHDIGFESVGFAPVTSTGEHAWSLAGQDLDRLLAGFRDLAEDYVAAAIAGTQHGFANLHDLLGELHRGTSKAHPCGAGLGLVGVSTEGEISPCHRFVESAAHVLGDVRTGIDEERRAAFLRAGHVAGKPDCASCFARPHCAGGCYHEAHVRYGDAGHANLHACDWIRAWTALGLECYARIWLGNPGYLERFDERGLFRAAAERKEATA